MKKIFLSVAMFLIASLTLKAQIPCNPAFTFTVNPSGIVTFAGTPTTGSTTYSWNFGNGTSGWGINTQCLYNAVGTYTVCLVVQDSSFLTPCIDSSCQTITITSPGGGGCNANFTIFPDSSAPHTYIGLNTSTGTGLSYLWTWGDGSAPSTGPFPTHTYAAAGNYTICLTVTGGGCVDSMCASFGILKTAADFTVTFQGPASVNNVNKEAASLYPNPVNDKLHIKGNPSDKLAVEIYTLSGSMVFATQAHGNQAIDVNSLPSNLYMVRVVNADGKASFAKFMKQ